MGGERTTITGDPTQQGGWLVAIVNDDQIGAVPASESTVRDSPPGVMSHRVVYTDAESVDRYGTFEFMWEVAGNTDAHDDAPHDYGWFLTPDAVERLPADEVDFPVE